MTIDYKQIGMIVVIALVVVVAYNVTKAKFVSALP